MVGKVGCKLLQIQLFKGEIFNPPKENIPWPAVPVELPRFTISGFQKKIVGKVKEILSPVLLDIAAAFCVQYSIKIEQAELSNIMNCQGFAGRLPNLPDTSQVAVRMVLKMDKCHPVVGLCYRR